MDMPKKNSNGLPYCNEALLYLLQENGGLMYRVQLRTTLSDMGYSKYCIYEAFRRCEWKEQICFEGNGHSKNQLVMLTDTYEIDPISRK